MRKGKLTYVVQWNEEDGAYYLPKLQLEAELNGKVAEWLSSTGYTLKSNIEVSYEDVSRIFKVGAVVSGLNGNPGYVKTKAGWRCLEDAGPTGVYDDFFDKDISEGRRHLLFEGIED